MPVIKKLAEIRKEVGQIASSKMDFGRTQYNYISEAELTSTLRPLFDKYGLVIYPSYTPRLHTHAVTDKVDANREKTTFLTDATVVYRIVDSEDDSEIEVCGNGQGMDSGDKASPKALTQCYKVAMRQSFMIPSPGKEDPDTTSSEELRQNTQPTVPADDLDTVLGFGQWKGKTFRELLADDKGKGYIKWLAEKSTDAKIKSIARKIVPTLS